MTLSLSYNWVQSLYFSQNANDLFLIRCANCFIVGGATSLAGLNLQRLTNNYLADGYLTGLAPVCLLGYSIGQYVNIGSNSSYLSFFLGAICSIFLLLILFISNITRSWMLIVTGILVGNVALSLIQVLGIFNPSVQIQGFFSQVGYLDSPLSIGIIVILLLSLFNSFIFDRFLHSKSILQLHTAHRSNNLYDSSILLKIALLLFSVILLLLVTTNFGIISLIGFLIPNMLRLLLGSTFRAFFILTFVVGGIFLLITDLLGQFIFPPYGLPPTIITSLLGIPFFLWILIRNNA